MGTLKFIGGSTAQSNEVSTFSQIESLLAGNLTLAQVESLINTRLSDYANKTYVDVKDGTLADSAFIDAADALRLDKSKLNLAGYPFKLNSEGKVPADKVKVVSVQKYPKLAASSSGGGGTTTSEIALLNFSVDDPGYPYKLFVTGTVSGSVASDNGSRPQVFVSRGDGTVVARGYGVAESYQAPALGSASSRMYASGAFTPAEWPNVIVVPAPIFNSSVTYHTDWQNLSWIPENTDPYSTTMSGTTYMQAMSSMENVTISAAVSFANGLPPADSIGANVGTLVCEMQIYSSRRGVIASAAPSSGKQTTGTLTAVATGQSVTKGDLFTVQVKQKMYCPWGTLSLGRLATWAPTGTGVSNTLTLVPGLAAGLSGGEITVLPVALTSQTAITGSTTLSVRLQSSGGTSVTALTAPSPRIMAIPIPA